MDSFINPALLSSAQLLSQTGIPIGFQSHFSDFNDQNKLLSQPALQNMNPITQHLDMNLYARALQAPTTLPFGMESTFGFSEFAHPTNMDATFCSQNELLLKNDVTRFEPLTFDLQDEPVPDIENDDELDPFNTPFNHYTSSLMQKTSLPIAIPQQPAQNILTTPIQPVSSVTAAATTPIDRDDEELEDSPELPTSPQEGSTPSNSLVPVSALLSSGASEYLLQFQQKKQPQSAQTVGHINLESDVYVAYQNIQFSLETPLHLFGGVQLQVVLVDWENNVVQGGFCQGDLFPVTGNPTLRKVKLNKMRPLRSACPFTSRRHNRLGPFRLKIFIPELGINQPLWNSSPFFVISHPKYESEVKKEH